MMSELWKTGDNYPTKYYKLQIYFQQDLEDPSTRQASYIEVLSGDTSFCQNKRAGRVYRDAFPGIVIIELELCKTE